MRVIVKTKEGVLLDYPTDELDFSIAAQAAAVWAAAQGYTVSTIVLSTGPNKPSH